MKSIRLLLGGLAAGLSLIAAPIDSRAADVPELVEENVAESAEATETYDYRYDRHDYRRDRNDYRRDRHDYRRDRDDYRRDRHDYRRDRRDYRRDRDDYRRW